MLVADLFFLQFLNLGTDFLFHLLPSFVFRILRLPLDRRLLLLAPLAHLLAVLLPSEGDLPSCCFTNRVGFCFENVTNLVLFREEVLVVRGVEGLDLGLGLLLDLHLGLRGRTKVESGAASQCS